jgi:hypothetical protein
MLAVLIQISPLARAVTPSLCVVGCEALTIGPFTSVPGYTVL